MQGKMTIIHMDGTVTEKILDSAPTLEELQEAVGGYIELVPRFNTYKHVPCVVFCNENGKNNNLPFNDLATALWEETNGTLYDVLVGDVVILTGDEAFLRNL